MALGIAATFNLFDYLRALRKLALGVPAWGSEGWRGKQCQGKCGGKKLTHRYLRDETPDDAAAMLLRKGLLSASAARPGEAQAKQF